MEALEAQLGRMDAGRRQVERRLADTYTTLRRVTGLRLDGAGGVGEAPWRPSTAASSPTGRRTPGKGQTTTQTLWAGAK